MSRKYYLFLFIAALLMMQSAKVCSQANTALSNLAATSVNQDLTPSAANTRSLGTAVKAWRRLFLDSAVYIAGSRFVAFGKDKNLGSTSLGILSLVNSSGTFNTALGNKALQLNTTGKSNVSVGALSLNANTTGINNVALGHAALFSNKTGSDNNAIGVFTMEKNTSGQSNVAVGSFALHGNTGGSANIAIGMRALFKNLGGNNSVAVGDSALFNNTGSQNVAVGSKALYLSAGAQGNMAIGYRALYANNTGSYNVASGHSSLIANTSGSTNAASGGYSLYANTTGSSNTAHGYSSLVNNTTGNYNTGLGKYALYYITAQSYNTAVGYSAGDYYSGANNTFLGAFATLSTNGFTNTTAIGYNAVATASNQIMLGNNAITSVKTAGSVVIYSDGRFKKDIVENVPGLDFINQLRPVTYHYDVHGMNDKMGVTQLKRTKHSSAGSSEFSNNEEVNTGNEQMEDAAIKEKEQKLYTGFIAQEVEEAAKKAKFDFGGIYKPQNDKDIYGLSYSDFVAPLVKAVQELSKQNAELREEIEELKTLIKDPNATGATLNGASLSQNSPNPVKGNTVIQYNIPTKFRFAQLVVYDAYGQPIKQVNITAIGRGTLNLNVGSLAAGEYNYSLLVDGKAVSTRKMILVH